MIFIYTSNLRIKKTWFLCIVSFLSLPLFLSKFEVWTNVGHLSKMEIDISWFSRWFSNMYLTMIVKEKKFNRASQYISMVFKNLKINLIYNHKFLCPSLNIGLKFESMLDSYHKWKLITSNSQGNFGKYDHHCQINERTYDI